MNEPIAGAKPIMTNKKVGWPAPGLNIGIGNDENLDVHVRSNKLYFGHLHKPTLTKESR